MSVHVSAGTPHTYRASGHDTALSEVCTVHCVLMPRALLVAGFSEAGRVIMARCNNYAATDPAWEPGFFEQEFIDNQLLGVPQQVKALFLGSRETLMIPDALYEEGTAGTWMKDLQPVCPGDVLHSYGVHSAGARYTFALPARIDKLLHRYFGHTPILPVAAYQLYKPAVSIPYQLHCLITQDIVIATLHGSGKLLWHQQFGYSTIEDIAWQIAHLCRELGIPRIDLHLDCTMLCDDYYDMALELERYFPKIKWASGASPDRERWSPVLYLLQQLYACAL